MTSMTTTPLLDVHPAMRFPAKSGAPLRAPELGCGGWMT